MYCRYRIKFGASFLIAVMAMMQVKALQAEPTDRLSLSIGKPTSQQNMNIETLDIMVSKTIYPGPLMSSYPSLGINFRVGRLTANDEQSFKLGGGIFLRKKIKALSLTIPAGLMWIEKSHFGADEWHSKDYGGSIQFYYGAELTMNIYNMWSAGYRFEHMSNGDRYHSNPALDSHNIVISTSF